MLTLVSGAGGNRPSAIHLSSAGRTTFGRAKKPPLATDHHTTLGQDGSDVSRFHASTTCQQLPDGTSAHRWLLNTLTSIQGFYRVSGSIPVGRLPGAIKGPFKAIRYYLGG